MIRVNKVFYSLQGEGVHQGEPTVFIRFQGCNLAASPCVWCDTKYAQKGSEGTEYTLEELEAKILELKPRYHDWFCITGGEPLAQEDGLRRLIQMLQRFGLRIEVETNGTIEKPFWWTRVDSWVADIKCPSSGVCGLSLVDDWFSTRASDQIKFVVGNQEDLDFARKIINSKVAPNPKILVGPVVKKLLNFVEGQEIVPAYYGWQREQEWLQTVAEFCKEMRVRYNLQEQKVIWGNRKGV